jgi:hypothetical protein
MALVQGRPGPEREPDVQALALHARNSPEREVLPHPAAEIEAPPPSRPPVAATEAGKGELKSAPPAPLGSPLIKDKAGRLSDPEGRVVLAYEFTKLDQAELQRELKNWSAHALDLRCTNPVAGMDQLQTAFTPQGIRFVIEPDAKAALKLGVGKNPSFAVYFEDVTAEEILAALQQLGNENRTDKRPGAGRFESLLVNGMKRDEELKLWRMFGVDLAGLNQRMPKESPDVHPGAKTADRPARVVTYSPGRSRSISAELKRLGDNGGQRRPGALQIILVLSHTKS